MNKTKNIILHFICWSILMFITTVNNINFSDYNELAKDAFIKENLLVWGVYILLFYLCYFFIFPKLFIKKRYFLFVLSLVVSFLLSFNIINRFHTDRLIGYYKNEIIELNQNQDIYPRRKVNKLSIIENRLKRAELNKNTFNILAPHSARTNYPIILVIITAFGIRFFQKWRSYKDNLEKIKRQQTESELMYLRKQTNPHFLFNTLNSIYSLVIGSSEEAGDAVLKLSNILRYMLYQTDKDKVSLKKEISIIEDYLDIQKLKTTELTKINFIRECDKDDYFLPPLILLPFVENAFKYGADNVNDSFINIEINAINGVLEFKVTNKIVCQSENEEGGIGISNIRRRLELLYPKKYILKTFCKSGDFFIYLRIAIF
ncbi:MAG: histidine kinase [Bacteroidetes bacterium]|nr:histidine kinase [Bacteroidota bacterium]